MLTSKTRSHGASPGRPARWITASAPALASVSAARSVTDARTTSSPAPGDTPSTAGGGITSSRRSVRPGRGSRVRSMDPIRPDAPVIRIVGTPVDTAPLALAAISAGSAHLRSQRPPPAQIAGYRVPRRLGRGELRDVRRPRAGVLVLVEPGVLPRERRAGPVLPVLRVDRRGQVGVPDGDLADRAGDAGVLPWPAQEVAARGQAPVAVDDAAVGDQVAVRLLQAGIRGGHGPAGMPEDVDRVPVEHGRA